MSFLVILLAGLVVFGVMVYVILDGFDLGVGILFPWAPSDKHRNVMMSSIAPVWDGNSTWLIYSGGILFAAFPTAYAIWMSALYIPIMALILCFILRGVTFEFRMKAKKSMWMWDLFFTLGSTGAAFFQGIILGAVIEGIAVENNQFVGTDFDWLSSFAITTGFSLVFGYALLGSTWLIKKTKGPLKEWSRNISKPILFIVILFIGMISLKTPIENPHIAERWFSLPNFFYLMPVPLLTLACIYFIIKSINENRNKGPFIGVVLLYLLGFFGLAISLWPFMVFPIYTIWDMAAPQKSLEFISVVLIISLPIVLGYTFYVYRLFHGKVDEEDSFYK